MVKKLGVFGYPISHSISPTMHNAACSELGIDFVYEAHEVEKHQLEQTISDLRKGVWEGANITIPYKETVIPFLDSLSDTAKKLGAVNTLIKVDNEIKGDNTDVGGFLLELNSMNLDLDGHPAIIFGNGGSARAVAYALLQKNTEVRIIARNHMVSTQLKDDLSKSTGGKLLHYNWTPTDLKVASQKCKLAVNCTPLGMLPNVTTTPWFPSVPFPDNIMIYDLVYNPLETMFTKQAKHHGLASKTGLGMLVQQGAISFELWTGQKPSINTMLKAAERKLYD
tara:strand:+ start:140 stop:982 length:843 start_codon:yes stop_codon:yes gene_type:complete